MLSSAAGARTAYIYISRRRSEMGSYIIVDPSNDIIPVTVVNSGAIVEVKFHYSHSKMCITDTGNGWEVKTDSACFVLDYSQVAYIVNAFKILQDGEGINISHDAVMKGEKL
jgi:hypothetical protein